VADAGWAGPGRHPGHRDHRGRRPDHRVHHRDDRRTRLWTRRRDGRRSRHRRPALRVGCPHHRVGPRSSWGHRTGPRSHWSRQGAPHRGAGDDRQSPGAAGSAYRSPSGVGHPAAVGSPVPTRWSGHGRERREAWPAPRGARRRTGPWAVQAPPRGLTRRLLRQEQPGPLLRQEQPGPGRSGPEQQLGRKPGPGQKLGPGPGLGRKPGPKLGPGLGRKPGPKLGPGLGRPAGGPPREPWPPGREERERERPGLGRGPVPWAARMRAGW
jgi:hypothetical protein